MAEVTEIELLLSDAQSELIFGILTGNMSELPAPDVAELQSVLEASGIDTNKQDQQAAQQPAANKELAVANNKDDLVGEEKPWVNTRIVASLAQVSLTVLKDAGVDEHGKSTAIANFAINGLMNDLDMFNDGQMKLKLKLQSIVLYDRRAESSLTFNVSPYHYSAKHFLTLLQTLLTPVALGNAEAEESQISVLYESNPKDNRMGVNVELYRPRIYLLPDSLLAVKRFMLPLLDNMTKSLAKWKEATEKANRK